MLRHLRIGVISLVCTLQAFSASIFMIPSSAYPFHELTASNAEDLLSDAYDGCISRLIGKVPEEKATSTCSKYVYGDPEVKTDLLSHESSSQDISPQGDESKTGEGGEDESSDGEENKGRLPEGEQDVSDAKTDEPDEPEDQIMVIEGGRKVAGY